MHAVSCRFVDNSDPSVAWKLTRVMAERGPLESVPIIGAEAEGSRKDTLRLLRFRATGLRGGALWPCTARTGAIAGCVMAILYVSWHSSRPSLVRLLDDKGSAISVFAAAREGRHSAIKYAGTTPDAEALLRYAESMYSSSTAEAFAMLAKLAYCGPLPGVHKAAAASCSTEPSSACSHAQFRIYPGSVRTFSARISSTPNSLSGFLALIQPLGQNATVSSGVLISIRGSIRDPSNSARDSETHIVRGLSGCRNCGVHAGYRTAFRKLEPQIEKALASHACLPPWCRIYITGHGAGAAVGSILAWELFVRGYAIGTSYFFSTPRLGDDTFARRMGEIFMGQRAEPIFHVVDGGDRSMLWPFGKAFRSWGLEAYYAQGSRKRSPSGETPQICFAGEEGCGMKGAFKQRLRPLDTCRNPLAENGTMCTFLSYTHTCLYGWGFQDILRLPEDSLGPPQPVESRAASWPPESDQAVAAAREKVARNFYSLPTLQAFAALVKLTYCPSHVGLVKAVPITCNGRSGNRCGNAGFGVVPGTVVPTIVDGTLFFYTALIQRSSDEYAGAPYFMPSEACVLAIRGTANAANMDMNLDVAQVPLNDPACPGCAVNHGIESAWHDLLEAQVLQALKQSGCQASPMEGAVNKLFVVGHSMGGTLGALAFYHLQKQGFQMQLSWMMEGGRPGNPPFMTYLNEKIVSNVRLVPFWLTTHKRDVVPRTTSSNFAFGSAGRAQFMVHFPGEDTTPVFCTSKANIARDSKCGIYQYPRYMLSTWKSIDHCALPFAPSGNICNISTAPLQCVSGIQ